MRPLRPRRQRGAGVRPGRLPPAAGTEYTSSPFRRPGPAADMALPQGFLDELRDRVSVSSVVGRHHQLVRKGREFVALCPFHSDSKPSLNIVDEKGFYHCFACGAHGDVIRFVMESEGLGFRSEEHTSELQSLMRTSYAVFCLKKK